MIEHESQITLSNNETVSLAVVRDADADWLERILTLFTHKGEPWHWQNHQFLTGQVDFETRFFVLHRAGVPFAALVTADDRGVGALNHVWTQPEDRGKGASSVLMGAAMRDFAARGGQMMVLQTEFDSVAYRMYQKFGFQGLKAGHGHMHWYANSEADFERRYFDSSTVNITPIGWNHWIHVQALLQGDFGDTVRSVALAQFGRQSTSDSFLSLLKDDEARGVALQNETTGAVMGFAVWGWHPVWPSTCIVDLYCHPSAWDHGEGLLSSLRLPKAERFVAFADARQSRKKQILESSGFHPIATLERWVAESPLGASFADVTMFSW